ncbi:arginine-hydroxylase NDUFAF5, mitochondrial isoform X1 [Hydra vulgaris]|uniref:Arginine-hydroxylase NDUFAF5, mitochondrial n=1 Tax=Hydra vulgaris TaxID=6087 RepID=T2MCI7_HYDVU|nr:arginine-hydroxylase NDUFAF5, mitochondrial isoform X1 [Hydra vulgaris]
MFLSKANFLTSSILFRPSLCGIKVLITKSYSSNKGTTNVFDEKTKVHQKRIAAKFQDEDVYDYLKNEVAERVADRLADILKYFPKALDFGAGKGYLAKYLNKEEIGKLYQLESTKEMLDLCKHTDLDVESIVYQDGKFPFEENSLDLILSSLSLHWINDLPAIFSQLYHCLKEDGVFLAAMFGKDTLFELRCALQLAEIEREGGFGPHVSPFTEMRDVSALLNGAGFNLTTIDQDEIIISYPSMFELMHDLKGMGENNATWTRKNILHRDSMLAAAAIYNELYGNGDGSIPATFQIIYMIGWKPSKNQPKPLERGSATASFKDLEKIASQVNKK